MSTHCNILKTQAGIEAWVKAIANLHGPVLEHLSCPEDCEKIVQQFEAAGVRICASEAQGFWYAYCATMSSGWMTPFVDCVGVLEDMASEIEDGTCRDESLAQLKGLVQPAPQVQEG